jgi:glucose-6-phosphate 1-dehydrogenase
MQQITPTVAKQDIICVDAVAPPNGIVVFGASGDLTARKLLPSLFRNAASGLLSEQFFLIGCGRKQISDRQFRKSAEDTIQQNVNNPSSEQIEKFLNSLYYIDGNYDDPAFYNQLKQKLTDLDKKHKVDSHHIFYLSVPPFLYPSIAEQLGSAGLACKDDSKLRDRVRLVVEKPFGKDLQTAAQLNDRISRCFDESQVYRIDHYLGKETVQNILIFRFANTIFEPIWNRNYIDSIQITIAETVGVEHRAGYYDKSGALRDMFQNHMLQMLALVAMEPPTSFEADRLRDEKVKLLRSIRPFDPDKLDEYIVRGQYAPGTLNSKQLPGYRQEPNVDPDSKTETYVAAKVFIDNWRWKGVPFYLRTGKRLCTKDTEVAITFKNIPHSMFAAVEFGDVPSNVLVLQIQPEEGISLSFQAKCPGSKICISALKMDFSYKDVFGVNMPEAYQRLLLDCMLGDQTLFTRYDAVQVSWQLLEPILKAWENPDAARPHQYPAGSQSFQAADQLIESDSRKWRSISEV